jgi:uncharacterized coiled-coil DUF342 family protein
MKKGFFKLIALSVLVITFASCAKPPQAEMDAANASIEQAKTAGADRYVPASFNAATEALKTAQAAVEEQNAKFALFRNYDAAKTTLASVNTLASKAVTETAARKDALKAEVTQAVTDLNTLIAQDKEMLAKAPKGKEGKAALEAIGQEIAAVEAVSAEVSTGLTSNGDILTLSEKVKPAVEKAKAINTELTDVMSKVKGGKKAPAKAAAAKAPAKAAKKK